MDQYLVVVTGIDAVDDVHEFVATVRIDHPDATFHLVVPDSWVQHARDWTGDHHPARRRLDDLLASLLARGVDADGEVGTANPVVAALCAMCGRHVDTVVVAGLPPATAHWLGADVASRVRDHVSIPVVQLPATCVAA